MSGENGRISATGRTLDRRHSHGVEARLSNGSNDRFAYTTMPRRIGEELPLNLVDGVIGYDLLIVEVVYSRSSDGVSFDIKCTTKDRT